MGKARVALKEKRPRRGDLDDFEDFVASVPNRRHVEIRQVDLSMDFES